jgi:hypothetical protein
VHGLGAASTPVFNFMRSPAAPAALTPPLPLPARRYVFQGVHMLLQMTSSANGDVAPWKPGEERRNRLVFIGRGLDREELTTSFEACLVHKA